MVAAISEPPLPPDEQRLLLYNFTWEQYCQLNDLLGRSVRVTYLEGRVELMTVGHKHELFTHRIGRLVVAWTDERGIDLRGHGSTTFRKEVAERGLEPDACFTIGPGRPVPGIQEIERPDIAIEVIVTSPLLDKLEVYAGLEVPEVWTWRNDAIVVFVLEGDRYRSQTHSELLPDIDLALIAELAKEPKEIDAVRALRAKLNAV